VASGFVTRSLGRAATHFPGIRRLPVLKLLAIAEVGMLARDHLVALTPVERHRLFHLIRLAHGRPSSLSDAERTEFAELVAKFEPRLLAGVAADKLSPVPLPKRLLRGPRKSG